jgi:hypothetical protein
MQNTSTVNLHDLAKEIGMATLLKAHVVVLVSTGRFAKTVERFAQQVAETTPLQVALVPGPMVQRFLDSGERSVGVLTDFFRMSTPKSSEISPFSEKSSARLSFCRSKEGKKPEFFRMGRRSRRS